MVFAAFCCVYAVVNVILFGIVGGFLTYPLMALIGDVRMVRSSVGAYLTLPAIVGLIGIPCVYLASVGALTRATRAASSPRWVSATPAILAAAWVAAGHYSRSVEQFRAARSPRCRKPVLDDRRVDMAGVRRTVASSGWPGRSCLTT